MIITHEKFGDIRIVEIEGIKYYCAVDVAKALNYNGKNIHSAITRHCENKIKAKMQTISGIHMLTVIPKEDVLIFLHKSKKTTYEDKVNFGEFLTAHDVIKKQDEKTFVSRKEIEFLSLLEPIVEGYGLTFEKQKKLHNYRIDGYIPEIKLAIEFDENGHNNYDEYLEGKREKFIKEKLECEVVRVSDKIYVGLALSQIIQKINRTSLV